MAYDESLATRIRSFVGRRKGFTEKKMFGGVGFLLNGNMCVGVWKKSLIARLGKEGYAAALREPDVKEFDITGKSMAGWVLVEPSGIEEDSDLKAWIDRAVKFVKTLPEK